MLNTNASPPQQLPPPLYQINDSSTREFTSFPPFRKNDNPWKLLTNTTTKLVPPMQDKNKSNKKQERIITSILDLHHNIDARLTKNPSPSSQLGYRPLSYLTTSNALPSSLKTNNKNTGSFIIYALDVTRTLTAAGIEREVIRSTSDYALQGRTFPLFGFLSFLMLLLNSLLLIIQNVNINNNNNNNDNNNNNNNDNNNSKSFVTDWRVAGLNILEIIRNVGLRYGF